VAASPSPAPASPAAQARPARVRLLFVCLGNICRSPTAEGVMRSLVERDGLQDTVQLDSAGTGAWHVGSPPDARASETARTRGVVLEGSARQVTREDFEDFDLLLAMDSSNMRELIQRAPGEQARTKVRLLREFDAASASASASAGADPGERDLDVPDPYYGEDGRFEEVFDLVHAACEGLLARIRDGSEP
jgi:protein-tyrosine phosphatase